MTEVESQFVAKMRELGVTDNRRETTARVLVEFSTSPYATVIWARKRGEWGTAIGYQDDCSTELEVWVMALAYLCDEDEAPFSVVETEFSALWCARPDMFAAFRQYAGWIKDGL